MAPELKTDERPLIEAAQSVAYELPCKDSNCCERNTVDKAKCKRLHVEGIFAVLLLLVFGACSLLFYWNYCQQQEIVQLRADVSALLKLSSENSNPSTSYIEEIDEDSSENLGQDDVQSGIADLGPEEGNFIGHVTQESNGDQQPHTLMKRGAPGPGKERGKKRGRKEKKAKKFDARKLLRKAKAIAIHVQAQDVDVPVTSFTFPAEPITQWKIPDSKTFIGFRTDHLRSDGYITVPAAGIYYVYSQVVFVTSDLPYMVAEVGVHAMGQTTFAKCQFSNTQDRLNGSYVTCHSNGVVYLNAGDDISLMVNPANVRVYLSSQHTYFGAFLLGV
ncbi:unnamed protein product [Clavelina lepadiformis]|uniref:THD domain-containing protein n=1 Tax=Clavelina lepadiformis TaxID=159417 RepID=A0ABP0FU33_CLALP